MKKIYRIGAVIILLFLLFLVRSHGVKLFYDPFIQYFNGEYLTGNFPEFNTFKLFLYLIIRYIINAVLSIAIIYFVFLKKELINFIVLFYLIAFVILSLVYLIQLKFEFSHGYLLPFYIRRMLIHPMFLILLLPTFYFQRKLRS